MTILWDEIFDNFGEKTVTRTDKSKSAYVPNKEQRAAIIAAGIVPGMTRPAPVFDVTVLFDDNFESVQASYYDSERSDIAARPPEPRMGRAIISSWLQEGDVVIIGNIGSQIFVLKSDLAMTLAPDIVLAAVVNKSDPQAIFERANMAVGKPAKRTVQRDDFVRNPYVIAAALLRADNKCEMPGCKCELFTKDNGLPYLEVHHVEPLGENGDDTLVNTAALCPNCHRQMHSGNTRASLRVTLKGHIASLPFF